MLAPISFSLACARMLQRRAGHRESRTTPAALRVLCTPPSRLPTILHVREDPPLQQTKRAGRRRLGLGPDLLEGHPARDDADGTDLAVVERNEAEVIGRDEEVEPIEEHLRAELGALAAGGDRERAGQSLANGQQTKWMVGKNATRGPLERRTR
jgi:hypothetical protein